MEPPIRDYDAPDIIVNSIIPLFEGGRFPSLSLKERVEVYQYLFGYWQSRRGGGDPDVERVKAKVRVPARPITNRRRDVWRPAPEVYLSRVWSGDDRLERLYDGFSDVAFLYEVRGLDVPQEERREWARFWKWLGISTVPRLLVDDVPHSQLKRGRWKSLRKNHPHAAGELWEGYLKKVEADYAVCAAHGEGYRQLRRSVTMEGLAGFVEKRQADRLWLLYDLMAENWSHLKGNIPTAEVYCYRKYCPQYSRSERVPSFFEFLFREAAWIPARTHADGEQAVELYKPAHCWFVSAAETPLVRNLLPSPPVEYNKIEYRPFCRDIGMRFVEEASIEDLVDLLRHLLEQHPDPTVAASSGRRMVPGAIGTLSRWVIERIYNLLAQDRSSAPDSPAGTIPLVAADGDGLRYVHPPEPVFFADDRYHTARWRDHLPFASLDKNWGPVAEYLGIKPISACVKESCIPGEVLEDESNGLENSFKRARPYLLAVASDQRESETQEVARYLSNLEVRVVESLIVERSLTISPGKTLVDQDARVYLEETTADRVGSAGRAPRAGVLYVRKGFEENHDLLAGPLAEYVRIPGLADAFVILLNRGWKPERMRYLRTRGLTEDDVQEMRRVLSSLGVWDGPDDPIGGSPALTRHLLDQISESEDDEEGEDEQPRKDQLRPDNATRKRDEEALARMTPIELPEIDLSKVHTTYVDSPDGALPDDQRPKGSGRGGGGRRDWERDQRLREAYGKRGEELVKLVELQRLQSLGMDRPDQCVRWLREKGDETADHDIESKDLVDGEWVDVVIEVKATPANDFRFQMSRAELSCAWREGARYRLYRVVDVASAAPEVYVFENPYTLWKAGRALIEPRDTYVTLPDPR